MYGSKTSWTPKKNLFLQGGRAILVCLLMPAQAFYTVRTYPRCLGSFVNDQHACELNCQATYINCTSLFLLLFHSYYWSFLCIYIYICMSFDQIILLINVNVDEGDFFTPAIITWTAHGIRKNIWLLTHFMIIWLAYNSFFSINFHSKQLVDEAVNRWTCICSVPRLSHYSSYICWPIHVWTWD
jgi:hypothetical protein